VPEENLVWRPLLAGGFVYLGLALALMRMPSGPGSRTMGLTLGAIAVWLFAAAAEHLAKGQQTYLVAMAIKQSAITLTAPALFLFTVRYTERATVSRRQLALLFVLPLCTIALVWTNPWHGWMWAHPPLGPSGERITRLAWGPWWRWAHIPFCYAVSGAAIWITAGELFSPSKLYRAQAATLLVALLLPLIVGLLFLAGFGSARLPLVAVASALSGLIFAWGFVRLRLFQLSPIAYRTIFDHMRDGVVVVDRHRRVVEINPVALSLAGRGEPEVIGFRVEDALPWRDALVAALEAEGDGPHACRAAGGRTLELSVSSIRLHAERSVGAIVLLRDVTVRERAEQRLREGETWMRRLIEHSPNGILHLRPKHGLVGDVRDFLCVLANPAAAAILGEPAGELVGSPFKNALHPHTPALFRMFRDAFESGESREVERQILHSGRENWFRFVASPVGGDLLVTFFDVTDRKEREREMEVAASQDLLTGLLNRRGLEADAPALLRAAELRSVGCCLLFLDLDGLKQVNDSLGHEAGDYLLTEFAARVHACTRGPDLFARVGGDEFVLLLPETKRRYAEDVAYRIVSVLREPVRIGSAAPVCGVSIGIAQQPRDGSELKELLQAADRAMYAAKARGGGIEVAAGPR